jgi:demethylmenaquinone methyltransferase/2-methoxy-6-polyprenyl-1,4-benzoquinol methylase
METPQADATRVRRMFDRIAPRYDLLNRVLSGRRDVAWRKALARHLPEGEALRVLDLATGTGDVLLTLMAQCPRIAAGVGIDPAARMLAIGARKLDAAAPGRPAGLVLGDATAIAAPDAAYDAVTIAFGIRNVSDPLLALSEMRRVLRPGGRALVLEFSLPAHEPLRSAYLAYFRHVLPRIGGAVSGDAAAYRYLNSTVEAFPYGEAFCGLMRDAGFTAVQAHPLTFGIASIYRGDRPGDGAA